MNKLSQELRKAHSCLTPKQAQMMIERLKDEVKVTIFRYVTLGQWKTLSFSDKAHICTEVVKALLDKEKVLNALNGGRLN